MTSPFKTYKEFSEAEGAIYTFANSPAMIGFLLILCTLLLFYFLYKSYTMKQDAPKVSASLSVLLASAVSLASLIHHLPTDATRRQSQPEAALKSQPLLLFGMVGMGATALKRRRKLRDKTGSKRPRRTVRSR